MEAAAHAQIRALALIVVREHVIQVVAILVPAAILRGVVILDAILALESLPV